MHHLGIATRFSLVLACSLAASCGSESKPDAGKSDAKTDPGKLDAGKTDAGKTDAGKTDAGKTDEGKTSAAEPTPTDTAVVEPLVEPAVEGEVAITPIAPTPFTATWREVTIPEAIELAPLDVGVLGIGASGYYQLVDGQLAALTFDRALEDGEEVIGVWPDDAWVIERREKLVENEDPITEIRLLKLRDGSRWVPQAYAGEQRFELDDHDFRKSTRAKGGLLVSAGGVTERVAGNGESPVAGAHRGDVIDFIETSTGKIYVISKEGDTFHVVTDCADEACVSEKSRALPLSGWTFGRQVTRDRNSVSVLASAAGRRFVLHARPTGWALGEFPAGTNELSGIWASEDGGLWIKVHDGELMHRDPEGTWRSVALPEGLGGITFALTSDQKELWIAGTIASAPAVFATQANAQAAAPAAPAEPSAPSE
ncbi:hypothetical protein ACNOYE_36070 [Nannocystaceae bacterium ST9]